MIILLTGASGLIGKKLGVELVRAGHQVLALSRNANVSSHLPFPCQIVVGDLSEGPIRHKLLEGVEAVVHLAGENVGAGSWSSLRKKQILESRTRGTQNLIESLRSSKLQKFVSASAIGFYGDQGDEILREEQPAGKDFLAEVCKEWESALRASSFQSVGVHVRLGIVLSTEGGALDKMLPLYRRGLGSALGSGQQWMSWIHLQDAVQIFLKAVQDPKMLGTFNAVAPNPVRNSEFSKTLAQVTGCFDGPKVPALVLKTVLGEQAGMVLGSQRVSVEKLVGLGYQFRFSELRAALQHICSFIKEGDEEFLAEQYIDLPLEKVFEFFSAAENLEKITPPLVHFKILQKSTPSVEKGSLIDYALRIHGVPVKWRTEIQKWDPPREFVDVQLKGPYSKWEHTHTFEKLGSGTLMKDRVLYRVPLGGAGSLIAGPLVRNDIRQIFDYRRSSVLIELNPN